MLGAAQSSCVCRWLWKHKHSCLWVLLDVKRKLVCGHSLGALMRSLFYHRCVFVWLTQACTRLHVYHRVFPPHSNVCSGKCLSIQTRPLSQHRETIHRRLYTVTCPDPALFVVAACTVIRLIAVKMWVVMLTGCEAEVSLLLIVPEGGKELCLHLRVGFNIWCV